MAEEKQKLTIETEAKGTDQAAQALGELDETLDGIADGAKGAVKPTEQLADAQDKAAMSIEDLDALLSSASISLGAMGDTMVKGSAIVGDFATAEINLADITKKASAAFAENAKVIGLLGAAGVAAVGFTALAKSIKFVIEESKALREELAKLREEQTGEEEELMAGQREIVNIARARRREGVLTPEEKQKADYLMQVGGERGRVPEEQMALFKQNIAALVGLKTGREVEELTMAGVEIPLERPAEDRRRLADIALRRDQTRERVRAEGDLRRTEQERTRTEAKRELETTDPLEGMGHIKAFLEDYRPMGQTGPIDKDKLIEAAREYYRLKKLREDEGTPLLWQLAELAGIKPTDKILRETAVAEVEPAGFWGRLLSGGEGTTKQIGLEHVLRDLIQTLERQSREPSTTIHNNSRFMYLDSRTQRRETRNGENYRVLVGDG